MTYDPLRLIQFCLEERIPLQIVDFAAAVRRVRVPDVILPPDGEHAEARLAPPERSYLTVEAPVAVGRDLQQPADQRDAYILIHVPRQALVEMSSRTESLIVTPPLIVRPS
jgi:hypothetical protein